MSLIFGLVVGFSLGLTGGGGSIFAVPLLVYGLSIPAHQAVGVSLAAVGATALGGALQRLGRGEVEFRAGLLFGAAGVLGAPVGAWLGQGLPEEILLGGFAVLMLAVAARMWIQARRHPGEARVVRAVDDPGPAVGPACRRDPAGRLGLGSRCTVVLGLAGALTGVLSGLFGVGGGFLIVPALVLAASLPIHRAVATSLLVIALVSAAGVASHALAGAPVDWVLVGWFLAGGLAGMGLGTTVGRRLAGPTLQALFAAVMVLVATYMLVRLLWG